MRFVVPSGPSSSLPTTSGCSTMLSLTTCTSWWMAEFSDRAARSWRWSLRRRATPGSRRRPKPLRRHALENRSVETVIAGAQAQDSYLESFAQFENGAARNGQGWLSPIRRAAITRFSELGFPTTHDEDWRITHVASYAPTPFRVTPEIGIQLATPSLVQFTISVVACYPLVFGNRP